MAKNKLFKADRDDYDDATAKHYRIKPDKKGHMGSVAPSGQVLKGRKHNTYALHKAEEYKRGSTQVKFGGVEYLIESPRGHKRK